MSLLIYSSDLHTFAKVVTQKCHGFAEFNLVVNLDADNRIKGLHMKHITPYEKRAMIIER